MAKPNKRTRPVKADVVERLRILKGFSHEALAAALDIHEKTLTRWLAEEPLYIRNISKLAVVLGTSPAVLIGEEELNDALFVSALTREEESIKKYIESIKSQGETARRRFFRLTVTWLGFVCLFAAFYPPSALAFFSCGIGLSMIALALALRMGRGYVLPSAALTLNTLAIVVLLSFRPNSLPTAGFPQNKQVASIVDVHNETIFGVLFPPEARYLARNDNTNEVILSVTPTQDITTEFHDGDMYIYGINPGDVKIRIWINGVAAFDETLVAPSVPDGYPSLVICALDGANYRTNPKIRDAYEARLKEKRL